MISDEDLILISRSIDNELTAEESTELKKRLLSEPELREVYDSLSADQATIDDMTSKIAETPMPDAIAGQLNSNDGTDSSFQWQMIAASFLIAVLGTVLYMNEPAQPSLAEVLDDQASGLKVDYQQGSITVIATFETDRAWCREYVTQSARAVACREQDSWRTIVSEPMSKEGGFQTASDASDVQSFVLENMTAQPLSAEEELERLQSW